jgi:hypothetical protein
VDPVMERRIHAAAGLRDGMRCRTNPLFHPKQGNLVCPSDQLCGTGGGEFPEIFFDKKPSASGGRHWTC